MPRFASVQEERDRRVPQETSWSMRARMDFSSTLFREMAPAGRATGWCWRCGHGFVVATGMDPCAVDSVRGVLAGVCVQAQEDEAARELEPALPLRAAAAGRVLPVVAAGGALWVAGRSFRSCERCGGMGRCSAHRCGRGHCFLGALAPCHELERRCHPQGTARIDSHLPVPDHSPSNLYGHIDCTA